MDKEKIEQRLDDIEDNLNDIDQHLTRLWAAIDRTREELGLSRIETESLIKDISDHASGEQ